MQTNKTYTYNIFAFALVLLALAIWMTACGSGAPLPGPADAPSSVQTTVLLAPSTVPFEPTVTPQPSQVPPTAVAVAANTSTASEPVTQTATPLAGARNAAAAELRAALAAMEALKVFQGEYRVVVDQSESGTGEGAVTSTLTGLIRNEDAHLTISSDVLAMELIALNGNMYQRNVSVNPNWVPLTEQEAQGPSPRQVVITPLRDTIGDPTTWEAGAAETLDGAECMVYRQDRYATAETFFRTYLPQSDPTREFVDMQLERAEASAWVCPDGYLRQTQTIIRYKPAIRPFQMTVTARVFDVNGDFSISAPAFDPKAPQGDATQAVQAAVIKTKTLDSYRFEISGVSDEEQVFTAQGAAVGENKSYVLQESESGSLHESEVLVYDGKLSSRPVGSQDAWQAADSMMDVDHAVSPLANFDPLAPGAEPAFIGSDLPFAWKQKETLDGMECDVYIQTQRVEIGANYELTVCPDGYWHRGQVTVSMEAGDMSRMLSMTTTTRLSDLNAPITIEAPE